jgi:uncharacterized protein (DUF1330 family)
MSAVVASGCFDAVPAYDSFPAPAALGGWWGSPEYAPLKQMRVESNTGDIIVVEGGH